MERSPDKRETLRFSSEKEELLQLEAEGKYLFHGSGADVEELEPRQAVDTNTGPDGDPAVFASNKAEFAIFVAIVNHYNCPNSARSNAGAVFDDGVFSHLEFGMPESTAAQLQDSATGWVYVFDKDTFVPYETKKGVEFVSHAPVKPLRKIRVSRRDLPEGVKIYKSD